MPLLGPAALAMWWDIAPDRREEFEHWHSHEHFRERMAVPGFRRGSRWKSAEGGEGFFVLYELEAYETLTSAPYRARLDDPTPWSRQMMPHHRNMVRSQCRVLESHGGGIAASMLTLRLSPQAGGETTLRASLQQDLARVADEAGIIGAHLLKTETPDAPPTTEQRLRGGDAEADWIVLVTGYDAGVLRSLAAGELARKGVSGIYELSTAVTPADLQR